MITHRSSVTKLGVLNPDAAKPGVVVTALLSPLTVSYVSGICEDTGNSPPHTHTHIYKHFVVHLLLT